MALIKNDILWMAIAGLACCSPVASADDWTIDAGLGFSHIQIENDTDGAFSESRPSFQIGVHRIPQTDWRLGTSVEWLIEDATDWGGSENILMWRMGDIDYRVTDNLAINIHGGFARYFREQPSYGYGYGAGLKYRIASEWYISASVSRADVDISTNVPTDDNRATKDDLLWASLKLNIHF